MGTRGELTLGKKRVNTGLTVREGGLTTTANAGIHAIHACACALTIGIDERDRIVYTLPDGVIGAELGRNCVSARR